MKKSSLALILLVLGVWLHGQTVVIVTPGQISVGSEVHFRYDHEGGGGSSTYTWNFGDGASETTNNNQGHHAYSAAGTYTVTCMFSNMGGPPSSASATLTVVDNRHVAPQGGNFRQGRRVNFQADNFAGNNLTWNFGDGTIENGPRNHGHVYGGQGSFQVRVYEAGASESSAVSCQVTIEADNRRLDAVPGAPRANQVVAFSAQNFAGGGLHWEYGDGKSDNGGPSQNHVFNQSGSFQVRVWESSGTADDAVSLTLTVAPDNRHAGQTRIGPRFSSPTG